MGSFCASLQLVLEQRQWVSKALLAANVASESVVEGVEMDMLSRTSSVTEPVDCDDVCS
jgi:hypothetical protein